jgi:polysaccharide chain length determinant protein (PEP-CTERM system associated)
MGMDGPYEDRGIAGELPAYLDVPRRRPLHVLVPFVLVTAAAVAVGLVAPKQYLSSTLILVEKQKVPDSFVPRVAREEPNRRLLTIRQEILSRTRLERILQELDPYPESTGRVPLTQLVERMRETAEINVKGDDAFSVEYVHRDPRMAMRVADRLATLFIEETLRAQESRSADATQFIESQLEEARRQLETREQALRRFKEDRMGSLPEQTPTNLATLQRLQMEQQALSANLQAALDRQQALELSPTTASPVVSELDQLRAELVGLQERYTDEHPEVRALTARIGKLEKQPQAALPNPARAAVAGQLAQARVEVQNLKARSLAIDRRIAEVQARVDHAPRTEQELASLTRDFQKLNENYLALLNKKLDAQMAQRLEERWKGERFRVLDPAFLPEQPISPNRALYAAAGAGLGLLAGLLLALAAELLDRSVKSARQLQAAIPYPVVATITHIDHARGAPRPRSSPARKAAS